MTMKRTSKLKPFCVPDKDAPPSPSVQPPLNPFDGLKSEDEEEELAVADRPEEEEEEEEVDEAELEAFLDGHLAVQLLQEGSGQGVPEENDHVEFNSSSFKAEEALRTCKTSYFLIDVTPAGKMSPNEIFFNIVIILKIFILKTFKMIRRLLKFRDFFNVLLGNELVLLTRSPL